MNPTETVPRPANQLALPGSPVAIRVAAHALRDELNAGSVDADGFAANIMLALEALEISVPPMFAGMISSAARGAYA